MKKIYEKFNNWDNDAKPMLRWWFPDASADLEQVKHQIDSFVAAGYGGVEVAMVPQNVDFDPAVYGWATENWKNIMKTILRHAPEDFVVDFTITAHWPPALDTIVPNSDAAMQQLPFTFQKVSPGEKFKLALPQTKLMDEDGEHSVPYIFTDNFVAASVAKVKENWKDRRITLEESSLTSVTDLVSQIIDAAGQPVYTKAGIPGDSDEFGNKEKLADRQFYYEIDLNDSPVDCNASEGDTVNPGDWILFAYYKRGTGQTLSGRDAPFFDLKLPRAGRVYATDYYSEVSTKAITDFWDSEILSDADILNLMKERKGAIFEDSIETRSQNLIWTADLLPQFEEINGYDLTPYLPMVASSKGSDVRFVTESRIERRVRDDYEQTMNQLYIKHHVKGIQRWTRTFNYEYRAQSYGGFIDTSAASAVLDIAEGETLGFDDVINDQAADKYRAIAGGVHMQGKPFVSQEALAMLGKSYAMTWKDALRILNRSMAAGANRAIFHGASFDKSFNNVCSQWPGWHAFASSFAESWTDRQTYWEDVREFNDYVSRIQSVLQGGYPGSDVAVFKKLWLPMTGRTSLLNNGYSYDIISGPHLFLPDAYVKDGIFSPGHGDYKAIIIHDVDSLEVAEAEKLLSFAKSGLPLVISRRVPSQVYGLHNQDSYLNELINQILDLPNTEFVKDEADLPDALIRLNVMPSVRGDCTGLRYVHRKDADGSEYYFIVNWTDETLRTQLSLGGTGSVYKLNPWSGAFFSLNAKGTEPFDATFEANEALVYVVSQSNLSNISNPASLSDSSGMSINISDWNLKLESWGPGDDPLNHPEKSSKTVVEIPECALGIWDDLDFSDEQLNVLKVPSAGFISGVGIYTAQVDLPSSSDAYLVISHGRDMITGVSINGVDINDIDHACDKIYIHDCLKCGTNRIKIKLVSPLNNRIKYENPAYSVPFGGPPPSLMEDQTPDENQDTYDYQDYTEPFNSSFPEDARNMRYGLEAVTIQYI